MATPETISIANLPTWTPSTDDILVFVDRADWVTKRADVDELPSAGWDVTSASTIADNALVRWDGWAKWIQSSAITLSDDGDLSGIRTETFWSSNDRSQMIFANPDGSGSSIFSYSWLGGYNSIEMVRNAKYDPTSADWIRFDVSKPVWELLVDQSGNFEYWTAPAWANPIANWEQQFWMSSTGSATFNVGSNDADFTIKKNTSWNAYVYDAWADTHSFSGATSITGNLTATNLSGTNTGDEPSASTTVEWVVELATSAEWNTGTDATRALTPDGFAGSNFGIRYVACSLNGTTALTTSDKAYFRIPSAITGMNLVSVSATVGTGASGSSSSGVPTFTVKNVTDGNQMLSTSLTVDASEYTSATAATPAVINTSFDDVVTDDLIEVACTVAGTGVTYATITLWFQLP